MEKYIERDKMEKAISHYIENGNLNISPGKIEFYNKDLSGVTLLRVISLLCYSDNIKYNQIASEIICSTDFVPVPKCNFSPMILSRLLCEYGNKITKKALDKIKNFLLDQRSKLIGDYFDFIGVNDNYPLMATYTCMCMSEIFKDHELYMEADKRLNQVKNLLKRRGVMSEYNSMDYTPIQLFVISAIENNAITKEFKEIALNVQIRIWFDFLCHCHRDTGEITGPYSRHYIINNKPLCCFIYPLLDSNRENILDELPYVNREETAEYLYYLTSVYNIPEDILDIYYNRPYPFEFRAKAEYSASNDTTPQSPLRDLTYDQDIYEYSAGETSIYSYQTGKYGIGCATHEWHNGVMTTSLGIEYSVHDNDKNFSRNIYCRYLINDESNTSQAFFDQGRKLAFGNKNRAVILYKPKIASPPPIYHDIPKDAAAHFKKQEITGNMNVESAKLVIMIRLKGCELSEIIIDDKPCRNLPAKFDKPKKIFIRDHDIFMAFHPLFVSDMGRNYAMTVRKRIYLDDDHIEISLYNYDGSARNFSKGEFIHIRNGFSVKVSSAEEYSTFEEFVENEKQTIIKDSFISTIHSRQTLIRRVCVKSLDDSLACEYSPASEGIKYITVNDFIPTDPKLSVSGYNVKGLPYME